MININVIIIFTFFDVDYSTSPKREFLRVSSPSWNWQQKEKPIPKLILRRLSSIQVLISFQPRVSAASLLEALVKATGRKSDKELVDETPFKLFLDFMSIPEDKKLSECTWILYLEEVCILLCWLQILMYYLSCRTISGHVFMTRAL